jgi:cation transport regulator ChaB
MPYETNRELPESVKSHLPESAQNIYREVFNARCTFRCPHRSHYR